MSHHLSCFNILLNHWADFYQTWQEYLLDGVLNYLRSFLRHGCQTQQCFLINWNFEDFSQKLLSQLNGYVARMIVRWFSTKFVNCLQIGHSRRLAWPVYFTALWKIPFEIILSEIILQVGTNFKLLGSWMVPFPFYNFSW